MISAKLISQKRHLSKLELKKKLKFKLYTIHALYYCSNQ